MPDIYRRAMEIPKKPRLLGWVLLVIGFVMLGVAVLNYRRAAKEEITFARRVPVDSAPVAAPVSEPAKPSKHLAAQTMLLWLGVVIGLIVVFLVLASFSNRMARRFRDATRRRIRPSGPQIDPWTESGRRLNVSKDDSQAPPPSGGPGAE